MSGIDDRHEAQSETLAENLGRMARDELDGRGSAGQEFSGRARFLDHVTQRRRARGPKALSWAVIAAAAASLLLLLTWSWTDWASSLFGVETETEPLGYTVGSSAHIEGSVVRAADRAPAQLEFSEGTSLRLEPRSALELEEITGRGASMRLQRGQLHADVNPRPNAQWQIRAGPFEIEVTGTRFNVDFDETQGALVVSLYEGGVSVTGPHGLDVRLAPGHRLSASADDAQARVRPFEQRAERSEDGTTKAAADQERDVDGAQETMRESLQNAPSPSSALNWSRALANGDGELVLSDARRAGVEAVLSQRSATDLAALMDAARYQGEPALALRTIGALRRRFPGSAQALRGLFLAGRLHEQGGNSDEAARSYRGYLQSAPAGSLAAETRGRLMMLLHRQGRTSAAQEMARDYLSQHPEGAHAAAARKLFSAP